jgi:hypothetical protein
MNPSQATSCVNMEFVLDITKTISISIIRGVLCLHAICIHSVVVCPSSDCMGTSGQSQVAVMSHPSMDSVQAVGQSSEFMLSTMNFDGISTVPCWKRTSLII